MPLPSSGTITLNQIHVEAGGSSGTTASINDSDIRALVGGTSGATRSFSNFYGASAEWSGTITSTQTNLNLRTWALANGWDGSAAAQITINSGVQIRGTTAGNSTAALTVDGSWPGGVTLINNGTIVGRGGAGGAGGNAQFISVSYRNAVISTSNGSAGQAGGRALRVTVPLTLDNNGNIWGGGGGGGGGGAASGDILGAGQDEPYSYGWANGGGGGGGRTNSSGSASGGSTNGNAGTGGDQAGSFSAASSGSSGSTSAGGSGGTRGVSNYGSTESDGGNGGAGGTYGAAGSAGASGTGRGPTSGGAGGAAGQAVNGNTYITWQSTGSRLGPIV